MATYKDTIITNQGLIWADRAAHGLSNFKINRVSATSTDLTEYNDDKIKSLTKLPDYNFSGEIVETTKDNSESDNLAETVVMFDNKNSQNSYYLRAIGLWATNTETKEEILYSVTVASYPDFLPSFDNKVYVQSKIKIQIIVGSNANVQITINPENIATVKYAQYNVIRELTDEDDVLNLEQNGKYFCNGANPKNNPWKHNFMGMVTKDQATVTVTSEIGEIFTNNRSNHKWIEIINRDILNSQKAYFEDLLTMKPSDNPEYDSKVNPLYKFYKR
ncbi:hypothetical protein GSH19_05185 [Lactobacillus sp. S2-2]|uniref:hypothetical protein n=1 Tax=Lactobacillus sp. S2-2 TaxID=2692917 RepID=UPI001F420FEA|nr:hypothetical protein [Lactobacillus sp. S2-2]MCF6515546.1 hypothetical protein [Lactobacillus sp. S2-2]